MSSPATSVDDLLRTIGELYVARRLQATERELLVQELRRLQARNAELELVPENEDPAS